MPVDSQHIEYSANLEQWKTTRTCVAGPSSVKKAKTKYLPQPNPTDTSKENEARYDDYLKRANYVNFTGSTLDGMLGMVFRKDIHVELQANIEYLKENANGGGLTLEQSTRRLISDMLQTGRDGILVDYPQADPGLSKADVDALNLQANLLLYKAENIINWRTTTVGGIKKLSLVVLKEDKEIISEDGFTVEIQECHRVLLLKEGVYIQQIYDKNNNIIAESMPRMADGNIWDEIPFTFVGSQNNDEIVDKSPLYDIAEINLAHYRNSADFEESCFIVGQPTPVLSGLTQSWIDGVMKGGVLFGSRTAILLPDGGGADLLQASENQMPSKGMDMKEQQMIKIGARIIQDVGANETAEAAKIRYAGQNSKLGTIVGNVESAIKQCFEWAMLFMGGSGDNRFEINREFYDKKIDPQLLIAKIQLSDRGLLAKTDMWDNLRSDGILDEERTDEIIQADIDREAM